MWCGHLDPLVRQSLIYGSAVIIGLVANQPLRLVIDKTRDESRCYKSDCMWRSRLNVNGDRKTGAVCNDHDLRNLARLVIPRCSPFFRQHKGAVNEVFRDIDLATFGTIVSDRLEHLVEDGRVDLLLEAAVTRLVRRVAVGQVLPVSADS